MEIKKGDRFLCNCYVRTSDNKPLYIAGKIYTSDNDNCITDEQGDKLHYWTDAAEDYFTFVTTSDNVNNPSHYTWLKDKCGIEVIDIVRHMDFCLGNVIKYVLRAGHKHDASLTDKQKEIEDLKKAAWYINDRIKQLEKEV